MQVAGLGLWLRGQERAKMNIGWRLTSSRWWNHCFVKNNSHWIPRNCPCFSRLALTGFAGILKSRFHWNPKNCFHCFHLNPGCSRHHHSYCDFVSSSQLGQQDIRRSKFGGWISAVCYIPMQHLWGRSTFRAFHQIRTHAGGQPLEEHELYAKAT